MGLLLLLASFMAHADEVGKRLAIQGSTVIAKAIAQAERDLEKAVAYGDEDGYFKEGMVPVARLLREWRENEEKYRQEFAPYRDCLYAGVDFNRYAAAQWERPSLSRNRRLEQSGKEYKAGLAKCRLVLKPRSR